EDGCGGRQGGKGPAGVARRGQAAQLGGVTGGVVAAGVTVEVGVGLVDGALDGIADPRPGVQVAEVTGPGLAVPGDGDVLTAAGGADGVDGLLRGPLPEPGGVGAVSGEPD